MKTLLILVMLCLVATGNAFAVIDPDPNSLGVYFDSDANIIKRCPVSYFEAILIVTNPTFEALKSLECYVGFDDAAVDFGALYIPSEQVYYQGDRHNLRLELATPLPATEATVVAFYCMVAIDVGPVCFTLGAAQPPSIEGDLPVVVDGDGNMFQIGMSAADGGVCAVVNDWDYPVVDVQSETWGGVKSLYR